MNWFLYDIGLRHERVNIQGLKALLNCVQQTSEVVKRRCPAKKLFLTISENSQESTCARLATLLRMRLQHGRFSVNCANFLRTKNFLWTIHKRLLLRHLFLDFRFGEMGPVPVWKYIKCGKLYIWWIAN